MQTSVPPPGEHGGDGARIAAALGRDPEEILDLSVSLNPFAPDVQALASRHLSALRRYPAVGQAEAVVAAMIGLPADRVVLTAGGSQAIALVAHHLRTGWVQEPDFSLYRRHLRELAATSGAWRSDPHNPTGLLAPAVGSDPVAVWDEAFLPLSAGTWSRHRPGWALGSLTKAFACPGLRLGYLVAPDPEEAATLRRERPEWAVGGLGCALAPELAELADPIGWTKYIATARDDLAALLRRCGWRPERSEAPWLLVPNAGGLREALAVEGVVVRDCTTFGMPDRVRIAVPGEAGLVRLEAALGSAAARI